MDNGLKIAKSRATNSYGMTFGMSFVTGDNKKVCAWMSCRDYLHDAIRTEVHKHTRIPEDGHPFFPKSGDPSICMDRLRIIFQFSTENLEKFNSGIKAINIMEDFAGMERSTAEIVTIDDCVVTNGTTVLVKGTKEYMDVPHLLSIMTLVMRFFTLNPKFKYKSVDDLTKAFNSLNDDGLIVKDRLLMLHCHKWMHHIMKERQTLFGKKTLEEMYPTKIGHNFHGQGGITELCSLNSPNKDVNNRLKKLKKSI